MYDVLIPTWNACPEIKECLNNIVDSFGDKLNNIIICDNYSTDDTLKICKTFNCKIIFDAVSLGNARLKLLTTAETENCFWIDSDVYINKEWFNGLTDYYHKNNSSFVYGVHNLIPERDRTFKHLSGDKARGFTNNAIFNRNHTLNVIDFDVMKGLNAYEDYYITQRLIENNYQVTRLPFFCVHDMKTNKDKLCNYRLAWNLSGEINLKGTFNFFMLWDRKYYFFDNMVSFIQNGNFKYIIELFTGYYNMFKVVVDRNFMFRLERG